MINCSYWNFSRSSTINGSLTTLNYIMTLTVNITGRSLASREEAIQSGRDGESDLDDNILSIQSSYSDSSSSSDDWEGWIYQDNSQNIYEELIMIYVNLMLNLKKIRLQKYKIMSLQYFVDFRFDILEKLFHELTEMQLEIHSNAEEMLTTANKTSNLIMEDRQSFQIKFITLEETIKQGFKIMNRGIFMALCIIIITLSIPCTIQVIKEFQL